MKYFCDNSELIRKKQSNYYIKNKSAVIKIEKFLETNRYPIT